MKDIASGTDREIFGKLGSVSLNDIVQLLGMSKRTATLELTRGGERGSVYFRDGQIVHASAGRYEGEESFIELLSWADAEFAVEEGIVSLPKISITKSTEALLLSTMTALDEVARVSDGTPIGVPPSITKMRPPRPRAQPTRSFPKRSIFVLSGLAITLGATLVGLSPARAFWAETEWQNLPAIDSPSAPGVEREAFPVPDAWAIANAVWERPEPLTTMAPPPPVATAVLGPGYLTVVVEPWARVELDGIAAGETPLAALELPADTHRITLVNDHVVGVIRDDIVIESGERVTKRYSFNDTGYVRVVVTPWADVSVDGRSIGQTPLGRIAVSAGTHSIRFVHPELGAAERNVTIVSGQTTLVKVQLP